MKHTIKIKTISIETKIIYVLWSCFVVCLCAYLALIAGTMVYGVDKKTAEARAASLARELADTEARILAQASNLTLSDASDFGLVPTEPHVAVSGEVLLGRAN